MQSNVNATPEMLVEELASTTGWKAYIVLSKSGPEALTAIREGLRHGNWHVRKKCADLLDHLADERCMENLVQATRDPMGRVRGSAIHSLACQKCKLKPLPVDGIMLFIDALNDKSIKVRRSAVLGLCTWEQADIRAWEALYRILVHEKDLKMVRHAHWGIRRHESVALEKVRKV